MAQRQRAQRQVLDVAKPQGSEPEMLGVISDVAAGFSKQFADLQEASDLAAMNASLSKAEVEAMSVTEKWRVENEGKPLDPTALSNLNKQYKEIYGKYSKDVSIMSRGKWAGVQSKAIGGLQQDNLKWGYKQVVANTENNINDTIKNTVAKAKLHGEEFNITKAAEDFDTQSALLRATGYKTVGKARTDKLLEDYESEYMMSFLIGAISKNPDMGLDLLQNDRIKASITDTKDVGILVDYAKATIEGNKQIDKANDWASQREFDEKVARGELNIDEVIARHNEGKLSVENLKRYIKMAGGEDPIDIETDYTVYNKLFRDIYDPDNEDLAKTYQELNSAFISGKIAVQDYSMLVGDITPDFYEATNKNKKMNASPVTKSIMSALDMWSKAKEDYAFMDDDIARMSRDLNTYAKENPRASTKDMKEKATELQRELIQDKYPDINWSTMPKSGQVYMDASGNRVKIMPDGTIEEL
jgi:hypothetical protein